MRIPGRALALCVMLAGVGLLAACGAEKPSTQVSLAPAQGPTPTPIFASDAEALAAATEAYTKYVRVSDEIGHDGGADPQRIRRFTTEAGLAQEIQAAERIAQDHAHGVGYTQINNVILQSREQLNGTVSVNIYVCQDLSDVDLRDSSGLSLVGEDRSDYVAYLATLTSRDGQPMVVASNIYWSGGGVCAL